MPETKPKRRELLFKDWDAVVADVEKLHADGYVMAGSWSLGQICNHLGVVMEVAVDGGPAVVPKPVQMILRWWYLPGIIKRKPTNARFPAPKFAAQEHPIEDAIGLERLRKAIARFNAADHYHPNPAFGVLARDQYQVMQLWHCEHHLSFLVPNA